MTGRKRVRLHLELDTRFSEGSLQYYAARYLNSGEVDMRTAIGSAIAVIFGPLGAAQEGVDLTEILEQTALARRIAESYWNSALASCSEFPVESAAITNQSEPQTETESELEPEPEQEMVLVSTNNDEFVDLMEEL